MSILWNGCGGSSERELARAVSNDGVIEARMVDVVGRPLGALSHIVYRVYVGERGGRDVRGIRVCSILDPGPTGLAWRRPDSLVIWCYKGATVRQVRRRAAIRTLAGGWQRVKVSVVMGEPPVDCVSVSGPWERSGSGTAEHR